MKEGRKEGIPQFNLPVSQGSSAQYPLDAFAMLALPKSVATSIRIIICVQ